MWAEAPVSCRFDWGSTIRLINAYCLLLYLQYLKMWISVEWMNEEYETMEPEEITQEESTRGKTTGFNTDP